MSNLKARFKTTSTVSRRSRVVDYKAGQYIFQSGDLSTEMYVIHEGTVEVVAPRDSEGDEPGAGVAVLEKGDFFGEMGVLEGLPRTASVRALTEVKLVRIDGSTFTQLLRAEPEIAVRIMRKLSRRLREAEAASAQSKPAEDSAAAPLEEGGQLPSEAGRLVHTKSQSTFPLPAVDAVLIGRRDPITGIEPHVDVSSVDPERSCSRQHAKLIRDGETLLIVEDIGTTNGTFVNEERLETGVAQPIENGDEVRFGNVVLVFEQA